MGGSYLNYTCFDEDNPEKYCLLTENPLCKEVGDFCDADCFVKPEYPYCTNKGITGLNASSKPEIVPPIITGGTGSGSGSTCPDGYQGTEDSENCRLSDVQCDEDVLYQETGGNVIRMEV
jgi:hypothetical protein